MSGPTAAARRLTRERAAGRCEYCRMHQAGQGSEFHIEHVRPASAGGSAEVANLALSCPTCNLKKATRTVAIDPDTGRDAPLYNPRTQTWAEHFAWIGVRVAGRTPTGRATGEALDLNSPRRLGVREYEGSVGLFPPDMG